MQRRAVLLEVRRARHDRPPLLHRAHGLRAIVVRHERGVSVLHVRADVIDDRPARAGGDLRGGVWRVPVDRRPDRVEPGPADPDVAVARLAGLDLGDVVRAERQILHVSQHRRRAETAERPGNLAVHVRDHLAVVGQGLLAGRADLHGRDGDDLAVASAGHHAHDHGPVLQRRGLGGRKLGDLLEVMVDVRGHRRARHRDRGNDGDGDQ